MSSAAGGLEAFMVDSSWRRVGHGRIRDLRASYCGGGTDGIWNTSHAGVLLLVSVG
jgi:hypothetical protein